MRRPRILIGEPSMEVSGLLERAVRQLGYEPVRFHRGIRPDGFDLFLVAPDFEEGQALARAVRAGDPGVPVVELEKPFRIVELCRRIQRLVEDRGRGATPGLLIV